jgi:hypothetical protein
VNFIKLKEKKDPSFFYWGLFLSPFSFTPLCRHSSFLKSSFGLDTPFWPNYTSIGLYEMKQNTRHDGDQKETFNAKA